MSEEKSKRDALRSALLGKSKRISKTIEIAEGVEIEIRQPTVGARSRIMIAAGVSGASQDLNDLAAIQIAAVVHCSFVPGTNERIFDAADRGVLEELPTNQWFDEVSGVALELMNSEPEKAGKA
jgi:hypothetical protein